MSFSLLSPEQAEKVLPFHHLEEKKILISPEVMALTFHLVGGKGSPPRYLLQNNTNQSPVLQC